MLKSLAFIAIASYCGLTALLWLLQDKLLFHPMPAASSPKPPPGWTLEPVADEATAWAPSAAEYGNRALLLVNYRGYGASEGTPSEKALFSDALELFDAAVKRSDVDGTRVALIGCSHVAAAHYRYLPVRWVVRHPFDSAARAPGIRAPAFMAVGTADTTIPPAHSKRLAWSRDSSTGTCKMRG